MFKEVLYYFFPITLNYKNSVQEHVFKMQKKKRNSSMDSLKYNSNLLINQIYINGPHFPNFPSKRCLIFLSLKVLNVADCFPSWGAFQREEELRFFFFFCIKGFGERNTLKSSK